MKKAGIIIGVLVIIVAVVLFGLSQVIEKKNAEKLTNVPNVKVTDNVKQENKEEPKVTQTPVVVEKPVEKIVEKVVEKTISEVSTINKSTLGAPYLEKEEIVVIAGKRLLLIDEKYDSKESKMLTYCFDVLTPDNAKLVLFMTEKSYDSYNVGDKLMVKYNVYKNVNDVLFPVVLSVSAISE